MRLATSLALFALPLAGCLVQPPPRAVHTTSSPPPAAYKNPAFDHTAEELEAKITHHTTGYTKESTAIQGRLEAFREVPMKLRRGRCYFVVVRLGEGATFSDHAKRGVVFLFHNGDRGMEVNGGPGIHGPGGVASGGCPQADADATFDLQANWGRAMDKSKIHELGEGPYTIELYSKAVSDGELAARKADEDRQIAESRRFQEEERRRAADRASRGCRKCQDDFTVCIADYRRNASRATCERERDSCAFREARVSSYRDCR